MRCCPQAFSTPLTYDAALARLGSYYEEQVGRKLAAALPEIAPHRHFEVWHDMWVFFEPANGQTAVTIKRPTEGINSRLVKSWMVDLAGRLEALMPLEFKEEPPLREVEGEIYASRTDLARALETETSMKAIATWEHAGLMVSAAPLTWVVMAPTGLHGVHHVTRRRGKRGGGQTTPGKTDAGNLEARHLLGLLRGSGTGPGGPQSGRRQIGGGRRQRSAGGIHSEHG